MRWLTLNGVHVRGGLDYGCGRGFDASRMDMEKFDPHFFPAKPKGRFPLITCIYVLNVVKSLTGNVLVKDIRSRLTANGVAYLVWRNDLRRDTDTQRAVSVHIEGKGRIIKQTRPFSVARIFKKDNVYVQ